VTAPVSPPGDRRPIAARQTGAARVATAWLAARGVSADAISAAGMVAGLLAGAAFAMAPGQGAWAWLAAALLVQLRLLANLLDGMVAVARGIASPRGELWNEIPDRVSDTAALAGLGFAAGDLALGLGAALAAMATAYIRAVGKGAGGGSDFSGPMAKQQRMFVLTVVAVVCAFVPGWTTFLPMAALWLVLAGSLLTCAVRLAGIARRLA
jgi:phosphatidylglycerophosphate synthase